MTFVSEMSCVPLDPATATKVAEACANCGKEGSDTIKLKNCIACYLVKYCSVDCQKIHGKQHKKACRERAAELKDEKLYGQGLERLEAHFCPICLLAIPFPIDDHSVFRTCCMKLVCVGCCHAAIKGGLGHACPFCRSPPPRTEEESLAKIQKRVAARDPEAISHLGEYYLNGSCGLEKSESRAIELWSDAAELGSVSALLSMGNAYYDGLGGVSQDKAKGMHCWESAAMQGDAQSRHILGLFESLDKKNDRAIRHLMISAKMGYKPSLDQIKKMFEVGFATKAQYTEGLKGYQDAVEETKSSLRAEAATLGVINSIR